MTNHISTYIFSIGLIMMLAFQTGCNEYGPAPLPKGFSQEILDIIPKEKIDSLQNIGVQVNDGFDPPNMDGIYLVTPYLLTIPYGINDSYDPGDRFSDYKYKFSGFNKKELTVNVDMKSLSGNSFSSGRRGLVAGSDGKFTVFIETTGETNGVTNTKVSMLSGEVTPDGIINWEDSFILTNKIADTENKLIPTGTGRAFRDGDGFSEKVEVFRMGRRDTELPSIADMKK